MAKDFIKIQNQRIRKSAIKKYSPMNEKRLNMYFNVSTYKVEFETFVFQNAQERDEIVETLDSIFIL